MRDSQEPMADATRRLAIRFEQAVYGSFAFRSEGYAVLARSPGCQEEWLAEFRAACQNMGEPPAGAAEASSLFALRLKSGPWAVVGVSPQGCDDRGRPGARAFHGLFVVPIEYKKAGCDPFRLAGALRSDWSAETKELPQGVWTLDDETTRPGDDPRALRIAAELSKGRRVALEEQGPIDALARQVWSALPGRVRARATVATWAFGNGNGFDLLAVPRRAGIVLDESYVDIGQTSGVTGGTRPVRSEHGVEHWSGTTSSTPSAGRWLWITVGAIALLAGVAMGLVRRGEERVPATDSNVVAPPSEPGDGIASDPEETRRVVEALVVLAERFGVETGGTHDATPLMKTIANGLRYRGPFLTDSERDALDRSRRDEAEALRWDDTIRHFADDRPLPAGFAKGALRWQVGVLAWSFHAREEAVGDPALPRRSAPEVVQALGEILALDTTPRPSPLSARYPALGSYFAFLERLPRR